MYKVSIINNGVEKIIHYPSADKEIPHLLKIELTEKLSEANILSFEIPINNDGFNLIQGMKTLIKVEDIRDEKIIFYGRALVPTSRMDTEGKFIKEVICEDSINFLNDTYMRSWSYEGKTPAFIISDILQKHNDKVEGYKKIYPGIIEPTDTISWQTNYEKSLLALYQIQKILGGYFRTRLQDGKIYLDYLQSIGETKQTEIRLGYNMKELTLEYDSTDIATRIIPIGAGEGNAQINIKDINNGIEYIEDISEYGVIEQIWVDKRFKYANELKKAAIQRLNELKQPRLTIQSSMLDLSYLAGHENEKFSIGDTIRIINEILGINVQTKVIEKQTDLLQPYNPKITLSSRTRKLSDELVEIQYKTNSIETVPQSPVQSINGQTGDVNVDINTLGAETPDGAQAKVDAHEQKTYMHTSENEKKEYKIRLYMGV